MCEYLANFTFYICTPWRMAFNMTFDAIHKVEEDLRLALAVAEDSIKAKSEFLDNMSHELRTPMNGVLGFLRIALASESLDSQRENISRAEKSAKDLMKIIDNVLDFREIENNKMKMDAVKFRLSDIFNEISNLYALQVTAKELTLSISYPAELQGEIVGDSQKLKQVLNNLIDNAVKFTDKGRISLQVIIKHHNDEYIEAEFRVDDTGIGILPKHMKSLFDPFWQADTSTTRKYGGTGFGLPLSKHLVRLLGGKIWAESEYGKGSSFYFTTRFQLIEDKDRVKAQRDDTGPKSAEAIEQATTERDNAWSSLPKERKVHFTPYDPNEIRILLVEDVEINQIIANELLTSQGYNVDIAGNGQEALRMITQKKYDVVLMDIQMPIMDGLTATQKIREIDEFKDLPIIAVSAHALPEDKERSLDCGMNDYITKPLDIIVLNTTLNKWLASVSV